MHAGLIIISLQKYKHVNIDHQRYHIHSNSFILLTYLFVKVIIGSKYNTTADIWSLACMLFEMFTGDFLFEPRKGPTFSKNDDHLA